MNGNFLVVSNNSFSPISNNGKTLEAIFSSFNKENIFQLYFRDIENPDYNFCNNYLLVTSSKIIFNPPILKGPNLIKSKFSWFSDNLYFSKFVFFDFFWRIKFRKKKDVLSFCIKNDFKFIFFLGGPYKFSHDLATYISSEMKIPLFFYLTDDYLFSLDLKNSLFKLLFFNRVKSFYQRTIDQSNQCFVIGETMSKVYSDNFNVNFKVLINSININSLVSNNLFTEVIVYSYFGSLHSNRDFMLKRISKIIFNFHNSCNKKFEIRVFTNSSIDNYDVITLGKYNVNFYPVLTGEFYNKKMLESNYLLHLESDNPNSMEKTKYSISTKLPEYFASKRLVIGFGPKQVSSMEIIFKNEIGVFFDSAHSDNQLMEEFDHFLGGNSNLYDLIVKRAFEYSKANFDISTNSLLFKKFVYNRVFK